MKRFSFVLMAILALFVITGCNNIDDDGGDYKNNKNNKNNSTNPATISTRQFWARNFITQEFYQLTADKLAENSRCEVWVEKGSGVTAATANKVASAYYSFIYPKMMNTFGYSFNDRDLGKVDIMQVAHWLPTGKTNNAKLTILLLDIQDGYTPGGGYVGGYFTPLNLYENDPDYPEYKSNELDMIYLDTSPSVPGSTSSNSTLAHEMQHLINYVSSLLMRDDIMDTWIDEGLSTAAEWVSSGVHPEDRWDYYNKDYSGLIKEGNNFYVWGNHDDNPLANLDDYATAYLFFQYLRLQSAKPSDIYFDILTSEYYDYRAVTTADDINSSHKNNWALLLRDWHAANYTNSTSTSSRYGYKNDSVLKTVKAHMFPGGTTAVNLYPGEGVYSITTTAESLPSNNRNIKYAGLSSSAAPNDTRSVENGARLTYNVNTDMEGLSESGSTTGIAPSISISAGSASVQMLSKNFSGPYKVDASYFIKKNGNKGISDTKIRSAINKNNGKNSDKNNNVLKIDKSTIERVFINE